MPEAVNGEIEAIIEKAVKGIVDAVRSEIRRTLAQHRVSKSGSRQPSRARGEKKVDPESDIGSYDKLAVISSVARKLRFFTADDVWAEGLKVFGDPRSLGPAMKMAERLELITRTANHSYSQRRACHRRPLRVWVSLISKNA